MNSLTRNTLVKSAIATIRYIIYLHVLRRIPYMLYHIPSTACYYTNDKETCCRAQGSTYNRILIYQGLFVIVQ